MSAASANVASGAAGSAGGVAVPRVIGLEEGWASIDRAGLQKLFRIIHTGGLQAQEQQGSRASSASSSAAAAQPALGFTNEEYAQLYTYVVSRAQQVLSKRASGSAVGACFFALTFAVAIMCARRVASSTKCASRRRLTVGRRSYTNDTNKPSIAI
jgi:hypothetical protein